MILAAGLKTPTKILIVSDDPSGGHRAAARAVNEAISQLPDVDSKVVEFHDICARPRRFLREEQFRIRNKTKPLTRWAFHQAMDPSPLLRWFLKSMQRCNHWTMTKAQDIVEKENPDVLLSVHMGTNALSGIWQEHGALRAPAHCVVTDYVAHSVWASDNIARYYVASEDVKKDLMRYGVPAEKIMPTGIPISPKIAAPDPRPQEDVKKALGLDPKRPVILIMGGSKGDQKYIPILRELERIGTTAQVVAVCGRNESARKEVAEFAEGLSFPVHARPFVDMRDYYHAADVVITKPGGLTTSEVMNKGKALVLVSPYPGMEEAQVGRLTKAGVAKYGDTPENAAAAAVDILSNPQAKASLEAAAKAFVKPDAAMTIARDLVASRRSPLLAQA